MLEKKYEYLHHIADAKFRAYGLNLEEAFENAADAMFNVMIDTSNIKAKETRIIELESSNIETLLVDWLSELLFLFEVDEIIFGKFKIEKIKKGNLFLLKAKAYGEKIDLLKHSFDTQVKAVTYHDIAVKINDIVCVEVTVDT